MGGKSRKGREEEKLQRRKEEAAWEEKEKKKKKMHRLTVRNTKKACIFIPELNDLSFLFSLFQNFFLKSLN